MRMRRPLITTSVPSVSSKGRKYGYRPAAWARRASVNSPHLVKISMTALEAMEGAGSCGRVTWTESGLGCGISLVHPGGTPRCRWLTYANLAYGGEVGLSMQTLGKRCIVIQIIYATNRPPAAGPLLRGGGPFPSAAGAALVVAGAPRTGRRLGAVPPDGGPVCAPGVPGDGPRRRGDGRTGAGQLAGRGDHDSHRRPAGAARLGDPAPVVDRSAASGGAAHTARPGLAAGRAPATRPALAASAARHEPRRTADLAAAVAAAARRTQAAGDGGGRPPSDRTAIRKAAAPRKGIRRTARAQRALAVGGRASLRNRTRHHTAEINQTVASTKFKISPLIGNTSPRSLHPNTRRSSPFGP